MSGGAVEIRGGAVEACVEIRGAAVEACQELQLRHCNASNLAL